MANKCLKLVLLVVLVCVIIYLLSKKYASFSNTKYAPKDEIGWNVSFATNINEYSCPLLSANDVKIGMQVGGKNFRNFYPPELGTMMGFDLGKLTPGGGGGDFYISQKGALDAFRQIKDNGGKLTVPISRDFDVDQLVDSTWYKVPWSDVLKNYKFINRLQIGLSAANNPTEVPLKNAIREAQAAGGSPTDNVITQYIKRISTLLQSIGRTDMEIILPMQGDDDVDYNAPSGPYVWGNIFGPPASGATGYSSDEYTSLQPWVDGLMQTIKTYLIDGFPKVYFAATIYPFYYGVSEGGDPHANTQPSTYAALIYRAILSVDALNSQYGFTKPQFLVSETGWPSYCEYHEPNPLLPAGTRYPALSANRIKASPCKKCEMWTYFYNPGAAGAKTSTVVFGKNQTIDMSRVGKTPRYWWVLSGDGTHADCWTNAAPTAMGGPGNSKIWRANGWSMVTPWNQKGNGLQKGGNFFCDFPQNTANKVPGVGTLGGAVATNQKQNISPNYVQCNPGQPCRPSDIGVISCSGGCPNPGSDGSCSCPYYC